MMRTNWNTHLPRLLKLISANIKLRCAKITLRKGTVLITANASLLMDIINCPIPLLPLKNVIAQGNANPFGN